LVLEFIVHRVQIFDVDLLWRGESFASVDEGIGVVEEVVELFVGFEGVYFAIEEGDVVVVL
jgi:hypothetical protein